MAVSIDGFCLVVRVSALEERYPGGVRGFLELGNPVRSCSDGKIARISFMHHGDVAILGNQLDALGLGPSAERPADWVCVAAARGVDPGCRWIEFGRYAGMSAAWLRGTDPEPLVIPPQWTPRHQLLNHVDPSKLRFIERNADGIETWEHVETGQKHYIARHHAPEPDDADGRVARFQQAAETIKPFVEFGRTPSWLERLKLRWSLRKLEQLLREDPEAWGGHWFLGMGRRALGQREAAYQALRQAYLLQPERKDVCREYVLQCMATERAKEAVTVAERIAKRFPDDVGLYSNYGLTLLVAGDVQGALAVTRRAHELEPDDRITRALLGMVEDVAAGRKPRPTRYPP